MTSHLRDWLTTAKLGRAAWVIVWDVASTHQLMRLPDLEPTELATLATNEAIRRELPLLKQAELISAVAPGPVAAGLERSATREVVYVAASGSDIRTRVQPLTDAGLVIEGVSTPALALSSIARARRDLIPNVPIAVSDIGATRIALAIVRDGLPVFAREIPWGFHDLRAGIFAGDEFTGKFAAELKRSLLFYRQLHHSEVPKLLLCGDYPHLRALTAPLITALDIEVETLDSMSGFDSAVLPAASEFRENLARFRPAWAAASDPKPLVNLLPAPMAPRPSFTPYKYAGRAGVAAAVVVGVAVLFLWWQWREMGDSAGPPPDRSPLVATTSRQSSDGRTAAGTLSSASPPIRPNNPLESETTTAGRSRPEGETHPQPGGNTRPAPRLAERPNVDVIPGTPLRPPSAGPPPRTPSTRSAPPFSSTRAPATDPVVQSILFSSGRRVALIDSRIVGIGDEIGVGRVVEIERDAVVVQTPDGNSRRLALKPASQVGTRP